MKDQYNNVLVKNKSLIFYMVMLSLIFVSISHVSAIPSLTDHTNNAATIPWEQDGVKDGSSAHNHRDVDNFSGATDSALPAGALYSAYVVWDNRNRRPDDVDDFDHGHGFIDEFGYGAKEIPRYFFKGANWNVEPAKTARPQIKAAFEAWGAIMSDRPDLVTGIAFEETISEGTAEVIVIWGGCPGGACGATKPIERGTKVEVHFNDAPAYWSFNAPAAVPADKYYFYRAALHEIGHVVGLDDQNDIDDVMYFGHAKGCPQNGTPGGGPCQAVIDDDSIHGVRDLYSIPIPPPIEDSVPFPKKYDFGDAPDPFKATPGKYPSRLANDGARHYDVTKEWLGARVDVEADSRQVNADSGDDGVNINLETGEVKFTVSTSGLGAARYNGGNDATKIHVHGWFDWNGDGVWGADELKVDWSGGPGIGEWPAGDNSTVITTNIVVPENLPDKFYIRFRLDYGENINSPVGLAKFGEVEDYGYGYGSVSNYGGPSFGLFGLAALSISLLTIGILSFRRKYRS